MIYRRTDHAHGAAMDQSPQLPQDLPSILVVDDVPNNLTLITDLLAGQYRCRVAINGYRALSIARGTPQPELILLDVAMPEMDGYEVCRELKKDPFTRDIPVIFLTAMDGDDDETEGFNAGGIDYITKPVSKAVLTARINAHLTLTRSKRFLTDKNELLENMVALRAKQLATMQDVIILAMASLAEARDNDTSAHVRRIQHYSRALAVSLKNNPSYARQLTDESLELIFKTSPLHDIGKVGVPDSILFKSGRLSPEEYDEMKKHSFFGGQTLMEVERQLAAPEAFVAMAHEIALHHHERWDGTGYPLGLSGEQIPLPARIVALADAYDALTSARVYKPPYPREEARKVIERERGRQFDPAVVDAFIAAEPTFYEIAENFADAEAETGRSVALQRLIAE